MGGGKDYTEMVEKISLPASFLQNFITFLSLTNLSQMMMLLHLFKPLVLFHSTLQCRIVGTWLIFEQTGLLVGACMRYLDFLVFYLSQVLT